MGNSLQGPLAFVRQKRPFVCHALRVFANKNAYRNGFCVLFHLAEGVADFTWHLGVTDIRDLPLAMSLPTFPRHQEILKENCPEMKRNFVKFRLETGH